MNVGAHLFRSLGEAGVEVVFGCPGSPGAESALWREAEAAGLRCIPLLTDQGVLEAALARHAAGDPAGIVLGALPLPEPGVSLGSGGGQGRPAVVRIKTVAHARAGVADAVEAVACGMGPVQVVLAPAVARAELPPGDGIPPPAGKSLSLPPGTREAVAEAALLLSLSARPVIWAGAGAVAAGDALVDVAEVLAAPVVTSTSGKAAISDDHPLAVGSLFETPEVARLLGGADAALAVGTSFSARSTRGGQLPLPMQLFHVDSDPAVVGRRYPTRLGIRGDAAAVLAVLVERLRERAPQGAARDLPAQVGAVARVRQQAHDRVAAAGPHAEPVLAALREAVPSAVPTVWDRCPSRWAVPLFPVPVAGSFQVTAAGSPPGSSLAAALGVAAGGGPAVVVGTAGELVAGSHHLAAIAGASLPVIIIGFQGPRWQGVWADPRAGEPLGQPLLPDLACLGRAYGLDSAVVVDDLSQLAGAVRRAVGAAGPCLVVVGPPSAPAMP